MTIGEILPNLFINTCSYVEGNSNPSGNSLAFIQQLSIHNDVTIYEGCEYLTALINSYSGCLEAINKQQIDDANNTQSSKIFVFLSYNCISSTNKRNKPSNTKQSFFVGLPIISSKLFSCVII